MDQILKKLILQNVNIESVYFVFPTKIAAQIWGDWIIRSKEENAPIAVNMEQFIDWPSFKNKFIKDAVAEKESISKIGQKFFVSALLNENKQNHLFNSLIRYDKDVLKYSDSFITYFCRILPSLQMWAETVLDNKDAFKSDYSVDEEDQDLLVLYKKYKEFLNKNGLYDSAWEKPPMRSEAGEKYIIIYPEILQDWYSYKRLLENAEKSGIVQLHHIPEKALKNSSEYANLKSKCKALFFNSSVTEVRNIALYVRSKHDEEHIAWSDIVLSVPDIEAYGPYIEKEFAQLDIPVSVRSGKSLNKYAAGKLFEDILFCKESNFSLSSLKSLFLNKSINWNNEQKIQNLLNFGQMNKCFVSLEETDIWLESFKNQSSESEEFFRTCKLSISEIQDFYLDLKTSIIDFTSAETFIALNENLVKFFDKFLVNPDYKKDILTLNEKILLNCKKVLEKMNTSKYANTNINAYIFYLNFLQNESYVEAESLENVQILPYKTVASAPVKINIIAGTTQASLSLTDSYKTLSFITDEKKREKILEIYAKNNGLINIDSDPTNDVIHLYELNSEIETLFTGSEQSWSGYGYQHSEITDFLVQNETDSIQNSQTEFKKIHEKSFSNIKALKSWKNKQLTPCVDDLSSFYIKALKRITKKDDESVYVLSASTMKAFWKCPQKWLFEKALEIEEPWDPDAIIDVAEMGSIRHKIFELYVGTYKSKGECLPDCLDESLFEDCVDEALAQAMLDNNPNEKYFKRKSVSSKNKLSKMKIELVSWLKPSMEKFLNEFSGCFVVDCELESKGEIDPITENHKVKLTGSIDCVLKHNVDGTDKYIIIDYKSSKSSIPENRIIDEENPDKVPDMQMPLYVYFLEKNGYKLGSQIQKVAYDDIERCTFFNLSGADFTDCINLNNIKKFEKILLVQSATKNIEFEKRFPNETEASAANLASTAEVNRIQIIKDMQAKYSEFKNCFNLLDAITKAQILEYDKQKNNLSDPNEIKYWTDFENMTLAGFDETKYPCRESDYKLYESSPFAKIVKNYFKYISKAQKMNKLLADFEECVFIKNEYKGKLESILPKKLISNCTEYDDFENCINDIQKLNNSWNDAEKKIRDWKTIIELNEKIKKTEEQLNCLKQEHESFKTVCKNTKEYIAKFCKAFESHEFRICKANQDEKICGKCNFKSLCRNYFEVAGRKIPETLTDEENQ